jgi:hypothetical protein
MVVKTETARRKMLEAQTPQEILSVFGL